MERAKKQIPLSKDYFIELEVVGFEGFYPTDSKAMNKLGEYLAGEGLERVTKELQKMINTKEEHELAIDYINKLRKRGMPITYSVNPCKEQEEQA